MKRTEKTTIPSPEACALTLAVIAGRMTREAAIHQLAQRMVPLMFRR